MPEAVGCIPLTVLRSTTLSAAVDKTGPTVGFFQVWALLGACFFSILSVGFGGLDPCGVGQVSSWLVCRVDGLMPTGVAEDLLVAGLAGLYSL